MSESAKRNDVDLSTRYMGLSLESPFVVSSSSLGRTVEGLTRLASAGAAAVVLPSLFEEQVLEERHRFVEFRTGEKLRRPEELLQAPPSSAYSFTPEQYIDLFRTGAAKLSIPVIPSLNATTPGGWTSFARDLERAGAPALELNLFTFPTDPGLTATEIEDQQLRVVEQIRKNVILPLAIKIGPHYTNLANFAGRLENAGANSLVLFNRFFQPGFRAESLAPDFTLHLSQPGNLRLPLRWIGLLSAQIECDLAATGGVLSGQDAAQAVLAGANVAMVCSVLLREGIEHLATLTQDLRTWLADQGHSTLSALQGRAAHAPDHSSLDERAQYIQAVQRAVQRT